MSSSSSDSSTPPAKQRNDTEEKEEKEQPEDKEKGKEESLPSKAEDAGPPRKNGKTEKPVLTAKQIWENEEQLTKNQRRKRYKCGNKFTRFHQVDPWVITCYTSSKKKSVGKEGKSEKDVLNRRINQKISLWKGDITKLEVEAIVNAANQALLGGGGIDGAIHGAAGDNLYNECKLLKGCATGFTKITRAHNLPSKYILHTIGPVGEYPEKLKSCYESCLQLCLDYNIKTVAFCGISTGIFGYPLENASKVACAVIRKWMENAKNLERIDRIVFCTFLDKEHVCYQKLMKQYFPYVPDAEYIQKFQKEKESYKSEEEKEPEKKEDPKPQNPAPKTSPPPSSSSQDHTNEESTSEK